MSVLMAERQHTHAWTRTSSTRLGSGLVRLEETCACGATRTRIGYPWNQRRL